MRMEWTATQINICTHWDDMEINANYVVHDRITMQLIIQIKQQNNLIKTYVKPYHYQCGHVGEIGVRNKLLSGFNNYAYVPHAIHPCPLAEK